MATRTDLGKIIITNGGEYDPEAVYEEMTFVLYNNSTYLALQTVSGVEPVDDRVNWQLMAKGFAGSEFEIEGYVYVENEEIEPDVGEPALNADKLGGQSPEYYAPQHEITDAFSEGKSYAVGDYCIYLNSLYRFTAAHSGPWSGTAVVPVTIAGELKAVSGGVAAVSSSLPNDYYSLKNGITIPDNADLYSDAYKVPGNYVCVSNIKAQSLKNCPVDRAFVLKVDFSNGATGSYYPRQTFTTIENDIVLRTYDPYGKEWVHKKQVALKSDFANQWSDIHMTSSGLQSDFFDIVEGGYAILGGKLVVVNIRLKPKANSQDSAGAFVSGFPKPLAPQNINYVSCWWHSLNLVHQAYIDTGTGSMEIAWAGASIISALLIGAVYIAK